MKHLEDRVRTFLSNLSKGEAEQHIDDFTDDVELHVCLGNQLYTDSYAGTFIGKSGATNFFSACKNFIGDLDITVENFHTEKNKVIVRGDSTCNLKLDGSNWKSGWMQIWTFKDDKAFKIRIFADFHQGVEEEDPVTVTTTTKTEPQLSKH